MKDKMVVVHMRATKSGVDLRHMVGVAQGMTQEELKEQGVWLEEEGYFDEDEHEDDDVFATP